MTNHNEAPITEDEADLLEEKLRTIIHELLEPMQKMVKEAKNEVGQIKTKSDDSIRTTNSVKEDIEQLKKDGQSIDLLKKDCQQTQNKADEVSS